MPTPTKQVAARRQEPERLRRALTVRSLLIGTALLFGAVLWVRHSELLVHTINLTEATPPVPAIAALLLLALLHPLLRRLGPRTGLTIREYQATAADLIKPSRPDNSRRAAVAVGGVIAGVLVLARSVHLRFPLHPLGYAMAAAYSYQIWGGFFVVWVLKSLIFKLGGVRMYKRLTPAFIGLALGHFFTMGIAWAIIGSFYGVAAERARVWFT